MLDQVVKYCLYTTKDGSKKITLRIGEWLPGDKNRVILANSFLTRQQVRDINRLRVVDVFYKAGTSVFSLRPEKCGFNWNYGMPYNRRQDHVVHLWRKSENNYSGYDYI